MENNTCVGCTSSYGRYVEVTLILSVNILCLCGNCLVVVTIYKCRELRTISNVLIFNLAVSAILMSLLVMPFWATSTLATYPVFGDSLCKACGMTASILFINSILTLAGIAVDRYFIICYPFKYQIYASVSKTCVGVLATWFHALVLSMPPLLNFGHYTFRPSLLPICMADYYREHYYTLLLFLSTFIPAFLIIFLCYFHIFRVARRQGRRVENFDPSLFTAPPVRSIPHRPPSAASNSSRASSVMLYLRRHFSSNNLWGKASRAVTRSLRQSRAYKTVIAIIGCFLACWTPAIILMLYTMFYASPAYYVEFVVVVLAFLNYILNPFICVTLNKDFRRGVKRCLGLRRRELVLQAVRAFATVTEPSRVVKVQPISIASTSQDSLTLNPATLDEHRRHSASVQLPIAKAYVDA